MTLTEAHREVPGIATRQFSIAADSPFQNQPMGKARIRTRCGVSIVAIMREGEVVPSPGPDLLLHPGDLLVAVGTQEGLDAAADILRNG
jgi:TrkA domain protein